MADPLIAATGYDHDFNEPAFALVMLGLALFFAVLHALSEGVTVWTVLWRWARALTAATGTLLRVFAPPPRRPRQADPERGREELRADARRRFTEDPDLDVAWLEGELDRIERGERDPAFPMPAMERSLR